MFHRKRATSIEACGIPQMRSNASNKQFGENMRLGLASYTEPKLGGGGDRGQGFRVHRLATMDRENGYLIVLQSKYLRFELLGFGYSMHTSTGSGYSLRERDVYSPGLSEVRSRSHERAT